MTFLVRGAQPGIDNRKKVVGEPERAKDKVRLAPHLVLLIFWLWRFSTNSSNGYIYTN
jgi:hypothetical protein